MDDGHFWCKYQDIYDANTNVTVTFGMYVGSGNRWMRITVDTKTTTVTFGPDGQAFKVLPHLAGIE